MKEINHIVIDTDQLDIEFMGVVLAKAKFGRNPECLVGNVGPSTM